MKYGAISGSVVSLPHERKSKVCDEAISKCHNARATEATISRTKAHTKTQTQQRRIRKSFETTDQQTSTCPQARIHPQTKPSPPHEARSKVTHTRPIKAPLNAPKLLRPRRRAPHHQVPRRTLSFDRLARRLPGKEVGP